MSTRKWMITGLVAAAFGLFAYGTVLAQDKGDAGPKAAKAAPDGAVDEPGPGPEEPWGPPQGQPGEHGLGVPPPRDQRLPMGPPGMPPFGHGQGFDRERGERLRDPEFAKLFKQEASLERQTRELVVQYRRASASERDGIKKQIEKLIGEQFEVRQQRRQLELKHFEAELQRFREAIERRSKARDKIIEKRVTQLLGKEEDLGF